MSDEQVRLDDGHLTVTGAMTLPTATALLASGETLIGAAEPLVTLVDLAAVTDVDSSGLAVLFGWIRAARIQNKSLRFTNPPRNLISLAEVYGVTELLTLS